MNEGAPTNAHVGAQGGVVPPGGGGVQPLVSKQLKPLKPPVFNPLKPFKPPVFKLLKPPMINPFKFPVFHLLFHLPFFPLFLLLFTFLRFLVSKEVLFHPVFKSSVFKPLKPPVFKPLKPPIFKLLNPLVLPPVFNPHKAPVFKFFKSLKPPVFKSLKPPVFKDFNLLKPPVFKPLKPMVFHPPLFHLFLLLVMFLRFLDKSFTFIVKTSPALGLLLKAAAEKLPDLNCTTIESAMRIIAGTAANLGIDIDPQVLEPKKKAVLL
ncbi:hypothetical protein YC2023_059955 [Brassica napus]